LFNVGARLIDHHCTSRITDRLTPPSVWFRSSDSNTLAGMYRIKCAPILTKGITRFPCRSFRSQCTDTSSIDAIVASLTGCSRFIASPLDGMAEELPQNVAVLFGFCKIRGLERCLRAVLHSEQRHENGLLIESLYGSLLGFSAL
jgi:hypothetical protein